MDKRIAIQEAAAQVTSGSTLALGGLMLYRRPMAFVYALLARFAGSNEPNDLTLLVFTASMESDLLVGAGMVSRIRTCYFGMEIFGLAPMFTYYANRGKIEVLEESEASLAFGMRAKLADVGFMPARAWKGTDLPRLRPDVRTVIDPYSGEELIAFPSIDIDFAAIHALKADSHGNALIGSNKGFDEELSLAADTVIVTAEEIAPELTKADIVSPFVDAVVHAPKGALPSSCHPLYPLNGEAFLRYTEQVSDPPSYAKYMQEEFGLNLPVTA